MESSQKMKQKRKPWMTAGCIVALLASCVILSGAGRNTDRKEAERLYQEGNSLFQEGKYKDAARSYEKALEIVDDFAPLYYNLAQAQSNLGQYEQAIKNFRQYIRLRPDGETAKEARDSIAKLEAKTKVQGPGPTAPIRGQVWKEPTTGLEFVWAPTGCFQMGSQPGEEGSANDERPVHEVCLDGYWLGRTEVTVGAFRRFVEATGYKTDAEKVGWAMTFKGGKWQRISGLSWKKPGLDQTDAHPVVDVSWNDAKAMIDWLSRMSNQQFGLPTEAEWEYACRSGSGSMRPWGASIDNACRYANVRDETAKRVFTNWTDTYHCEDGYTFTAPAGHYQPIGFGFYDMLGNVSEWCEDIYDETGYHRHQRQNPLNLSGGTLRVVRGGGWFTVPADLRCGKRSGFDPAYYSFDLGFRLRKKQ
jgi:formylglycine-generating enzyme